MEFIKKVLVLKESAEGFSNCKQSISGIIRIENESGVTTLYLSLINFAFISGGEYHIFILDDNQSLYSYSIGSKPSSYKVILPDKFSFEKGFVCGIAYIANDIPILTAFGKCENFKTDKKEFTKLIINKCQETHKINEKKEIEQNINSEKDIDTVSSQYDDEVVATENYFAKDDINEKINVIERLNNEYISNENECFTNKSQKEKEENPFASCGIKMETNSIDGENYSERFPYYLTVKEELENIFSSFPPEHNLSRCVPFSKWAKVNYSENKYYVVGIVWENKKEKYICYGVPSKFSSTPPKELKGFCSFVPISIFNLRGDGYWMMFQSAITGECISQPSK